MRQEWIRHCCPAEPAMPNDGFETTFLFLNAVQKNPPVAIFKRQTGGLIVQTI